MSKPAFAVALIIILAIDMMLFLGQSAVCKINPTDCPHFYTYENSTISKADAGDYSLDASSDTIKGKLPTQSFIDSVTSIFTDTFSVIFGWIMDLTGLDYIFSALAGPATFLKIIGAPKEIVYAVGAFWYLITFFAFISFMLGRE